ncbi:hypothetical protein PR202_ga23304 [Eleusine coracana subsp. coracana]|uniref:Uncharacterized protein n=1 Tax=Eleusine coracana subsp. coracana TaxID=191504 RepID=A0AAV5D5W3_ELECO|nr:hypothetical protein QOZ80_1AG0011660 [Eleusine coracana subsp. coracana]GJN05655.1 hypothetical protein PR202_ga23304 [Eleusine coracana subsp. coracana]
MAVASGTAFSVRPPAPAPSATARPCACAAAGGVRARADGGPGKWWAPLLGWSGQPDYIDAQPAPAAPAGAEEEHQPRARRFGVLTADKARQLRMQMMETESFHDAMYHSAIASRLASAAPDGREH